MALASAHRALDLESLVLSEPLAAVPLTRLMGSPCRACQHRNSYILIAKENGRDLALTSAVSSSMKETAMELEELVPKSWDHLHPDLLLMEVAELVEPEAQVATTVAMGSLTHCLAKSRQDYHQANAM